jgi:hypothetical protein
VDRFIYSAIYGLEGYNAARERYISDYIHETTLNQQYLDGSVLNQIQSAKDLTGIFRIIIIQIKVFEVSKSK